MFHLEEYMGKTPLVKLNNVFGKKYGSVYVKLEEFNPAGSIKFGMVSYIRLTSKLISERKEFYHLNQFRNLSNPKAHYLGTRVEILNSMNGRVDCFVAGNGSGGTIFGVGKRLKEYNSSIQLF